MTENMAGRGEGLAGLVAELTQTQPLPWKAHALMIRDARGAQVIHLGGSRDEFGRGIEGDWLVLLNKFIVAALEAAAPPSTPLTNEHELLVGGVVRAALELAILRGDLRMDSGAAFEEMSESEREDVISDTWNAMNGEGTCDDEPVKELTAIYAALATPSPQAPATTIKLPPPDCPSVDGKCPLCGSAVAMCSAGPYCSNKKCTWVDGYAISPLRQHREEDSPEDWARYLDSCKPPAVTANFSAEILDVLEAYVSEHMEAPEHGCDVSQDCCDVCRRAHKVMTRLRNAAATQEPAGSGASNLSMCGVQMEIMGCFICQGEVKNWCPTHGNGAVAPGSPRKVGEDGQPSKLRPTYYVRHPDDTFSVAEPQPMKLTDEGAALVKKHLRSLSKRGPARQELERWLAKIV